MNRAYIAFGSNLGNKTEIIDRAFIFIENNDMKITKKSEMYETEPYGYADQPNFINGAIEVHTHLNCREVLKRLLSIEAELGRVRQFKWGPRVIDLDIIFFNDEVYDEEDLIVPHPDMHNRNFVLKPLNDICPDYLHPILNKTVAELLNQL